MHVYFACIRMNNIDENSFLLSNTEKHAKIDLHKAFSRSLQFMYSLIVSSGSFQHAKGSTA